MSAKNIKPEFLIIDSIQTMYSEEIDSAPGSVSQVRACGNKLMKIGKTGNIPIFIVAHVTKSGELAGPKTVEHLVDCVLNFGGERDQELRILRSFKNRFGTTSEIGAFMMTESGLEEVADISGTFLEGKTEETEGAVTAAIYEGSRPVMFEVQALVHPRQHRIREKDCGGGRQYQAQHDTGSAGKKGRASDHKSGRICEHSRRPQTRGHIGGSCRGAGYIFFSEEYCGGCQNAGHRGTGPDRRPAGGA